jgi:hypothetical protein
MFDQMVISCLLRKAQRKRAFPRKRGGLGFFFRALRGYPNHFPRNLHSHACAGRADWADLQ